MHKQIIELIKRLNYLTYFIIGIIGIVMITLATKVTSGSNIYNVFMGIGCSLIASAFVTIILLVLIPEERGDLSELKSWGIKKIYSERGSIILSPKQLPKSKLDFIAFGLSHFKEANNNSSNLSMKL